MAEALARDEDRCWKGRVEIDTSAPFESVREAVTRFEGSATSTKPPQGLQQIPKISDEELLSIKEQTENLEKELVVKERETLDVLKELEATKMAVDGLKMKIKTEAADISEKSLDSRSSNPSPPSLILMELQQAKVNLTRATGGLVDIRASIESLSKEIENERAVIKETRERISSNSSKILELEKELHQTRLMIQFARDDGANGGSSYPPDISLELLKLNSEVEQYKRMAEAGELEVSRMRAEIQRMKASMEAAEIKKTEYDSQREKNEVEADLSVDRFRDAMSEVEEAKRSEEDMLRRVEEATVELESSRKALAEALEMAESTNQGKLAAEEALRRWRSEHSGQRRRRIFADGSKATLRPTLSIGQILSQKLYGTCEFEAAALYRSSSLPVQPKISLGEMLSRRQTSSQSPPISDHHRSARRRTIPLKMKKKKHKNFEFAGISLFSANQSKDQTSSKKKRKKKTTP